VYCVFCLGIFYLGPSARPRMVHQPRVRSTNCSWKIRMTGCKTGRRCLPMNALRRKRVHQRLDEGALRTARDFSDAAIIFQHGQEPEDYLLAHVLAMIAVAKGDKNGREIAAITLDRYLQSIGQAQIFGTQYLDRTYSDGLQARNCQQKSASKKAASTDQPNAKHPNEIVQEPYNPSFISDSFRKLYCVAGMDQQKRNLESLNAGKGMPEQQKSRCAE
jgi:hypothetical protein